MQEPENFSGSLFRYHPIGSFISILVLILCLQIATGTTYLMVLELTSCMILVLSLCFNFLFWFSTKISEKFLRPFDLNQPTVVLWFIPLLTLILGYLFSLSLLVVWPAFAGRGFWSEFLAVNAKTTAILFTESFMGFFLYIGFVVFFEIFRYLKWSFFFVMNPEISPIGKEGTTQPASLPCSDTKLETIPAAFSVSEFKEKARVLDESRRHASSFNKKALALIFFLMMAAGSSVVFFRPEIILFYRGEIQLWTFQKPEIALENYRHLAKKYPDYKYIDTVKFRTAWTLERRMGKYQEAVQEYEAFLKEFGFDNVWADDVVTNLIHVSLDKLKDYPAALQWTKKYAQSFPKGLMAPHIALYEVRALMESGHVQEAKDALKSAISKFTGAWINIYDSEDYFSSRISFENAVKGLGLDKD